MSTYFLQAEREWMDRWIAAKAKEEAAAKAKEEAAAREGADAAAAK